ncbi:C2 calcium-dependent domain-containing protein 6 isoform X4 [Dromiciops gliroides]|uniref:C2 calcium-dependent domain-containing protein 6 isoform X4 n=1 Tax=Dromiciops gliroides TaxID=33562 RepID=UPI001CC62BD9|nr:C2 calcium-dependent domain-containing protein 6 isoform X4 [Dromiciops gliroides]
MESSQTEKKVSDVNESQRNKVHSLFKVPFLHKSETGADENDESRNFDTISQASSLRHAVSSRTDPFREGSKEGTGRKLLNMLRKTLKGSESKDLEDGQDIPSLVPFGDVVGCLAVHIKKCRHFSPRINLQYYTNLFIRITINKIMKCTKAHSVNFKNNEKKPTVKFEEVKYFSVQVPRRQDDERNMIYLELMEFDDLEAYPVLLGSFSLHLYEIIQKGCFTEEFYMKIRNLVICKVEVEFMFSYGNFGYGFSHQLKPLQKLIQPSMFMHIPPPVERTDPLTNVITPQLIEYPAFLSPDLNVTIGTQQKQTPLTSPVRLEKLQQQPRDRLDRMKKEYRSLKTWEEKSCYLDQILRMKAETKEFPDSKMPLPRHVSFSISHETIELPSNADGLNKDVIEEYASWDQNKDKDEEKEKYNEGVGEKNEIDEEDSEIIIGNTYVEDYSFRQAHPESMTLFQGCQKSTIVNRGKFEPFLRNITEIPIKEDDSKRIQNVSICTVVKKDTSSAEIIEHEDQDPPYPPTSSSLTVNSENSSWESNPDIFTIKSLDTEEIRRGLSSFSLESFEGESSFTIDIDLVGKGQENLLSELLDLNPSLEKLEKTVVLKSILNDDLKDLSEELFSKQGFLMEIEVERKSQSLLNFNDETLGSSENAQNKIKIVQSEQIELSAKKSSSSKSSKKDLKIVQSEKLSELSGKKSSSSKSSKNDLKIVQSEQLSDLSRKKSSSSKSSKNDFKIVQSEQLSELSAKKSSSSKSSKNDLKIVQSEQLSELSVKKSSSSKSSFKTDLKIVQSEHIELSGKTSSGSKSSKTDLKIVQSEHLGELAGKTSSGSKSSKSDLKIVQSEQIELSGKTSSSSKSSKNNLKVVQSEQIELSGKTSSGSKSSKSDLKILQSEHLIELSGKTSSGSKSSKNDLKIVKSEQLGELLGKISSGSKLSKIDLKIVQSEQIELSGKISSGSKSSKIELKTVQSEQLGELSRKTSSSSKSSFKNDLKIGQSEQLSEPSVKKKFKFKIFQK